MLVYAYYLPPCTVQKLQEVRSGLPELRTNVSDSVCSHVCLCVCVLCVCLCVHLPVFEDTWSPTRQGGRSMPLQAVTDSCQMPTNECCHGNQKVVGRSWPAQANNWLAAVVITWLEVWFGSNVCFQCLPSISLCLPLSPTSLTGRRPVLYSRRVLPYLASKT